MIEELSILALGLVVGVCSAIIGIGGGALVVPILPMISAVTPHEAVATSLFTIFLVVLSNSWSFHQDGLVVWPVAKWVGPTTAVAAFTSGSIAKVLPTLALQLFFMFTLLALLLKGFWERYFKTALKPKPVLGSGRLQNQKMLAFGTFVGMLSGLTGIGAGLVVGPVLLQTGWAKNEEVTPTTNAIMMFTALAGALAYAGLSWPDKSGRWGLVHLDKVAILVLGAVLSAHYARPLQKKLAEGWRFAILSGLLVLLITQLALNLRAYL